MRSTIRSRPRCNAFVLAATAATLVGGVAGVAPPASAATFGTPGVCAKLGYDDGEPLALGTGSYLSQDDELVTASVQGINDNPANPDPDVRVLRRDGRLRGIALCNGDEAVACQGRLKIGPLAPFEN